MSKYALLLVGFNLLLAGCTPKTVTAPSEGSTEKASTDAPPSSAGMAKVEKSDPASVSPTAATANLSSANNLSGSSVPEGQLDFVGQLATAATDSANADAQGIIAFLGTLDKTMQSLLGSAGSPKLTQAEAARQARILSDMKLQAAQRLDEKAENRLHKELALLAKMEALSHASGLGDTKAAGELRQLASQTADIESKLVAHQAAIVLLGFELSDLAAGLSNEEPVLKQLDLILQDRESLKLPDFQVCAQTLKVLQQHGLDAAFEAAKQKTLEAFSNHPDPQLGMRLWYLEVGNSLEFNALNEAINDPEISISDFEKKLSAAESLSATQWTLAYLMQNFTNLEYSGQMEKAGLISSVIENRLDWIKIPDLRKDAESMIEGFKKRVSTIGQPFELQGLVVVPGREAFDPTTLKGKVVLVDFWASWCGPCRAEFPNLRELYSKYHDRGFEIVGVNLDDREADMLNVLKTDPLPWIHVRAADSSLTGFSNPLATELGLTGIPFLMLIGADGNTIAIHTRGLSLSNRLAELFPQQ